MRVYAASDYAGLEVMNYNFYYGYEHIWCPKHGFMGDTEHNTKHEECDDPNTEWAFCLTRDNKVIKEYRESELRESVENNILGDDMLDYVVIGMGKIFEENHSKHAARPNSD